MKAYTLALTVLLLLPASLPAQTLPATIPIFPLPDVVLFPGVARPLLIFEPRYRAMVADALKGAPGFSEQVFPEMKGDALIRYIREEAGARGVRLRGGASQRPHFESADWLAKRDADPAALTARGATPDRIALGLAELVNAGLTVEEFALGQPSLDEVFLSLTGHPAEPQAEADDEEDAA